MIQLALTGAGRMGRCHAAAIREIDGAAICGVYDPNEGAAIEFERDFGARIYNSEAELLGDKTIDGVLVTNYTSQHFQTLTNLLTAGHTKVFCEKALVRHLSDGDRLLAMAQDTGAMIMVGHHRRYQSGYIELKRMIDAGELGTVRMAKIHYCHPAYNRNWDDFFADFDRCGGVILDMMSHLFDQLNWYFGDPAVVSGNSIMFDRSQPLPMDYVSGTITYRNGVICGIDGSWQRHGVGCDRLEIYGDDACAVYEGSNSIHIYRANDEIKRRTKERPTHLDQMRAFVQMVRDNVQPVNSLQAGYDSIRVALTMIEAAQQNRTITLGEVRPEI